jgi:hypothetical protein
MNARGFFVSSSHRPTPDHLKVGIFNTGDGNKIILKISFSEKITRGNEKGNKTTR